MLRFLVFVLCGLLVAVVSAAVYNYLYMQTSPVSAKTAKVVFVNGTDASGAGTSVGQNGTYVKFISMSGWPNVTRVYENATVIKNVDGSVDFTCQLSRDSWSGETGSIEELYVRIYDEDGAWQGTLDLKTSNTTSFVVPDGEVWRVEWRIKWAATALSTDSVSTTVALRVTGEGSNE